MKRINRELVMLAHTYEAGADRVAGMFLSEKLDGMRCLWLPHTKGYAVEQLPFANREKDQRNHTSTGLWSRYGKPIHCPDFFTKDFPDYPIDGELWLGRGKFQEITSVCKKLEPVDDDWYGVEFKAFDAPTYSQVFIDGRINNQHWTKAVRFLECMDAIGNPADRKPTMFELTRSFMEKEEYHRRSDHLSLLKQVMLPFNTPMATAHLAEELAKCLAAGGEGLVLRNPGSMWEPIRSRMLLKVVPENDAEGEIVDFKAAEFGKDGKLLGLMGSAVVRWNGREFNLSGFTDKERRLQNGATAWAMDHTGELLSQSAIADPVVSFRVGDVITFTYKELTDDGIPKSARFKRKA